MKKFKLTLSAIILVLIIVFLLQNLTRTEIIFIIWSFEVSKAYVVLSSIILGIILAVIAFFSFRKKQ